MFARRRAFRGRGRAQREPVSWDRRELSTYSASAFGVVQSVTVFDPTVFVAGTQDVRLTVRRLLLEVFPTVTFSAAVAQGIIFGIGVEFRDASSTAHDPLLTGTTDQQADWLYLGRTIFGIAAGPGTVVLGDSRLRGKMDWDVFCPNIRAMRKCDQEEVLSVNFNMKRQDPATFAAPTVTRQGFVVDSSVLFSRTMRR